MAYATTTQVEAFLNADFSSGDLTTAEVSNFIDVVTAEIDGVLRGSAYDLTSAITDADDLLTLQRGCIWGVADMVEDSWFQHATARSTKAEKVTTYYDKYNDFLKRLSGRSTLGQLILNTSKTSTHFGATTYQAENPSATGVDATITRGFKF